MRRVLVLAFGLVPFSFAAAQPPVEDAPRLKPSAEALIVEHAQVQLADGSSVVAVGGCWLSTNKCVESAQRLVIAEARAKSLEESVSQSFSREDMLVALGVGAILGVLLGVGGKALLDMRGASASPAVGTHSP